MALQLLSLIKREILAKPTGTGTGLGLSVVKKIIDLHEGVITISNAPEGGARVTLVLRSEPKGEP